MHFFRATDYRKLFGGFESRSLYLRPLGITTHAGDEFIIDSTCDQEILLEDFEISDGVVIPPGDYEFDGCGFDVTGASIRAITPRLEVEAGEFYGGDIVSVSIGVEWRSNRHLFLQNHGFDARRGFSGLRSTQSQLAVKCTQTFRL